MPTVGRCNNDSAMSSTCSLSGDTPDEVVVKNLQIPATLYRNEKAYDPARIWRSQIKLYSPLFPNAAKILSQVQIPPNLSEARLEQFVSSTSITPNGEPFPPQVIEIIPRRLYLADEYSGTDKGELIGLGITHILCIGQDNYHDKACPRMPCIEHAVLPVPPVGTLYDVPLVGIIDKGVSYLRKALASNFNHKVLIHSERGDNWSASMAIGAVMDLYGCSYEAVHNYVKTLRENVSLHEMVAGAVQQWWTLEKLRPELPEGRGYRPFRWSGLGDE